MSENTVRTPKTREEIEAILAADPEPETVFTDRQREIATKAKNLFIAGYHCGEAIIRTFNEAYDLKFDERTIRMATGLSGGLGKAKCLCGTVSVGTIILSAFYGRDDMHGDDSLAFDLAKELHDRFEAKYSTVCCAQLTSIAQWAHPSHVKTCSEYVYGASLILADILDRAIDSFGPLETGD